MTNEEKQFLDELEIFDKEAREGATYLYCYLTIHRIAYRNKQVGTQLNRESHFWGTVLVALQTSAFMTLGRIFDQGSGHNVDRLLKTAGNNLHIFPKPQHKSLPDDFRRLRKHVKRYRKIYEENYRDLRNRVFAHNVLSDESEIQSLYAKTNVRELERLFVFPLRLNETLWELYHNGRKPNLRPMRFSHGRMLDKPARIPPIPYPEHIIAQTKRLLISIASRAV